MPDRSIFVVAHTRGVDVRAKTFMAEAGGRLGAVAAGPGFFGPEIIGDEGAFSLVIEVRYHRARVTVQCRLVLAYGGEAHVSTSLLWAGGGPDGARRVKAGDNAAHTGYQMRRVLDRHAEAVSERLQSVREVPTILSWTAAGDPSGDIDGRD